MNALRPGRRDYAEVVDFPVEIVGRDGVLRHYGFDDSVRLYRRRLQHAAVRGDSDEARQEVEHCRRRIQQLRRSYFLRYGWTSSEAEPPPLETIGEVVGEAAAFLARVLRTLGRVRAAVRVVSDDAPNGRWLLGVTTDGTEPLWLEVRRFEGGDADASREAFLAGVQRGRDSPDFLDPVAGTRCIASHHGSDFGLALCVEAAVHDALVDEGRLRAALEPTPWERVVTCIRDARHTEGLARCRQVLSAEPWQLRAALAASMLALHTGQPAVAEECALVGVGYYPRDAALHFYLALAKIQQRKRAMTELQVAVEAVPEWTTARLLLVTQLLASGDWRRARKYLVQRPLPGGTDDDARAETMLFRIEPWLAVCGGLTLLGVTTACLGLLVMVVVGLAGVFPVFLGAGVSAVARVALARERAYVESHHRFFDLSAGLRRWNSTLGVLDPL